MIKLTEDQKTRVFEIISENLEVNLELIKEDSLLKEDLGADSLHEVELTIEFEREFDIDIPDSDIENVKTVGDFIQVLENIIK